MDEEGEAQEVAEVTDPVRIQEGLLRKAQVLKGNVDAFLRQFQTANPLPPYPAMYARLTALRDAVNEFAHEAHKHQDLLSQIVLVPGLNFPAKYQRNLLEGLLRSKMEPRIEDWEHQHLKAAHEKENRLDQERRDGNMSSLSEKDRQELWNWAAPAAQGELEKHVWFIADYTMAEKEAGIEKVVHGLRRPLVVPELPDPDEENAEGDEDELFEDVEEGADAQDAMEVDDTKPQNQMATAPAGVRSTQRPMAMDKIHRFMTKGVAP